MYAPVEEISSVYFHPVLIRKRWMMVFVILLVHHHNHHYHHMSSTDIHPFVLASLGFRHRTLVLCFGDIPFSLSTLGGLLSHFVLSSCAIANSIDVRQNDKETLTILNLKFRRASECERFYGGLKMHQHLCEV